MELFSSLSLKNVMYVVTITFLGINVQGSDVYASLMVLTSISMKENFLASPSTYPLVRYRICQNLIK